MPQNITTQRAANHPQSPSDPTFSAIAPAGTLQTALDALDALVDECVLRADEDGLSATAMDPATVGLVELDLGADAFEAYDAAGTSMGVDLERLRDVVGMADRDQLVRLALDEETRTLHVRVGQLSYTLALIDPDAIRSPPDEIDFADQFTATVAADGAAFSRAVEAADMVSDHLELGVDEEATHLYARADGDTDTVSVEVPEEDCSTFDPGVARSLFSLQYLSSVERAVPADHRVRLRLGEEAPIEVEFGIADSDGTARYVISPRLTQN
ncbi:DNA polymerase sliding clamp [Halobacterium zhouii]|uniref:DNA polymerase sliding clamp n=1 Tax=Halobacterium zhouii TaxID=2902624 RepID=UPI001E4707AB|nr:DNA polymerase sliding clamp [Halobacterium zhouii]